MCIQMFIPSIVSQGDAEQQAYWLPLCFNLSIIGTYAQVSWLTAWSGLLNWSP